MGLFSKKQDNPSSDEPVVPQQPTVKPGSQQWKQMQEMGRRYHEDAAKQGESYYCTRCRAMVDPPHSH